MTTVAQLISHLQILAAERPSAYTRTLYRTETMNDIPPPTDPPEANNAAGAGCMARLVRLCLNRGDKPYELQGDDCGDETCNQCGQSIWANDFEDNHRVGYKSDRNQKAERHPDAVHLKTLCTGCKAPMDCYWPPMTTWGGVPCTAEEYMAKALQSENVGIYCDDCLEKMPDVKLEDLHFEPNA